MAITLGDCWQAELSALSDGWDSYNAEPISQVAIYRLESFSVVPMSNGGIQLEAHRDGWDIEIEIDPDGRIVDAMAERKES